MIQIDVQRATRLLLAVYSAYIERTHLFRFVTALTHAVQHIHIPDGCEKGSLQHVQWLFFATLTDRRQVSDNVYAAHLELRERHPHLYLPGSEDLDPFELADILIRYQIGMPRQSAQYWVRCARTLWGDWDGNPARLYGGQSIKDALKWKRGFKKNPLPGFGPKILSLFGLYLAELGKVALFDAFPVDVHVQRWFLNTDCILGIEGKVFNEEMERTLRPFITDFCNEYKLSWVDLSHALWFLGNRVCTGCAKNRAARMLCPSYDACGGSWNSSTYFKKGCWDASLRRFRKGGDTAFLCPSGPLFEVCI